MKIFFLVFGLLFVLNAIAQDAAIDRIVAENEGKIVTVFQKTEKNRMVSSHATNESEISRTYRYTDQNKLSSITVAVYSGNDTAFIMNYFFNGGQLVKVVTESYVEKVRQPDDVFYYKNERAFIQPAEINGPYPADQYVKMANRHLRMLRKKPIRFPG